MPAMRSSENSDWNGLCRLASKQQLPMSVHSKVEFHVNRCQRAICANSALESEILTADGAHMSCFTACRSACFVHRNGSTLLTVSEAMQQYTLPEHHSAFGSEPQNTSELLESTVGGPLRSFSAHRAEEAQCSRIVVSESFSSRR